MDNTIQSDLIRGHIDTIILKALYDGDRYGFDIIKEIEQKSSGQYILKQPTLYSCLKRLEVQGFIKSYWGAKSGGGRRKYYTLTEMGKDLFIKNQSEWVYSRSVIDKLISDRDFDFSAATSDSIQNSASEAVYEDKPSDNQAENEYVEEETEPERSFENNNGIIDGESYGEEEADEESDSAPEDDEQENTDEYERYAPNPRPYLDTTAIMNEMFEKHLQDDSYSEKLKNEEYVPTDDNLDADSYFNDAYYAEQKRVVPDDRSFDTDEIVRRVNDSQAASPFTPIYDPNILNNYESEESSAKDEPDPAPPEPEEELAPKTPDFYSYDSTVPPTDKNELVINREYKGILTNLRDKNIVNGNTKRYMGAEPEKSPVPEQEPQPDDSVLEEELGGEENFSELSNEQLRTRNFRRLESEVKDLGDGVKIRNHNSLAAKEYANTYYFYSNKLMLAHYLILFLIMILEIAVTYIAVTLGSASTQVYSVLILVLSVIVAAAFPAVAFILNLRNPEKKKRVSFNFKISMIFRIIVMLEAFILIYTANLMLGMPLTFDSEHLVTLLVPAIMATNIPVSAMIFQWLYKSNKYSVEE